MSVRNINDGPESRLWRHKNKQKIWSFLEHTCVWAGEFLLEEWTCVGVWKEQVLWIGSSERQNTVQHGKDKSLPILSLLDNLFVGDSAQTDGDRVCGVNGVKLCHLEQLVTTRRYWFRGKQLCAVEFVLIGWYPRYDGRIVARADLHRILQQLLLVYARMRGHWRSEDRRKFRVMVKGGERIDRTLCSPPHSALRSLYMSRGTDAPPCALLFAYVCL